MPQEHERTIGRPTQDEFEQSEFVDILRHFNLHRGRYVLDAVQRDGKTILRFSREKREWIQRSDLISA